MGRTAVCCTCVHRTPSREGQRERTLSVGGSVGRPAAAGKEEKGGKFRKLSIPAVVAPSFPLPLPPSVQSGAAKAPPSSSPSRLPSPPPSPTSYHPPSSHTRSQCGIWKAIVSACSSRPSLPYSPSCSSSTSHPPSSPFSSPCSRRPFPLPPGECVLECSTRVLAPCTVHPRFSSWH